MPSKKKKYNARFPAGRIKKIMQTDEEIGKVAQAVPIVISRTLELFVESLLKKAMQITNAKNAKTLSPTHMKQCILSESRFDFLKDLVKGIPDVTSIEEETVMPCVSASPATTPVSAKSYACFQFQHTPNEGGSSRSSIMPSQPQSHAMQAAQPRFYKEIPIGSEDSDNRTSYENNIPSGFGGATVIQNSTQVLPSNNFSSSTTTAPLPSARSLKGGRRPAKLKEYKFSDFSKTRSDNAKSASERMRGVEGRIEDNREKVIRGGDEDSEEEEEEEEQEEEEDFRKPEVRENGYHKVHKADPIDEDYDT